GGPAAHGLGLPQLSRVRHGDAPRRRSRGQADPFPRLSHGPWDPRKYHFAPLAIPVATQVPHAVGFAMGCRLKHSDEVVLSTFGDGATSEGDWHEAMNFAGVFKSPVIFLCQNNYWAISVPLSKQTAGSIV